MTGPASVSISPAGCSAVKGAVRSGHAPEVVEIEPPHLNSCPAEITRQSGSNLALTFFSLPKKRRKDMAVLYAFCRVVDDIVDEEENLSGDVSRQAQLEAWAEFFRNPSAGPALTREGLGAQLRQLMRDYEIGADLFLAVIRGMEMDLTISRYPNMDALLAYCYHAASAVGLISIRIFGCRDPQCTRYATHLGYALQLTNILRDVGADLRRDRIYLPQDLMQRHGVREEHLRKGAADDGWRRVMSEVRQEAEKQFQLARELLPGKERRPLVAARLMSRVYGKLLKRIHRAGYNSLTVRHRLTVFEKITALFQVLILGKS